MSSGGRTPAEAGLLGSLQIIKICPSSAGVVLSARVNDVWIAIGFGSRLLGICANGKAECFSLLLGLQMLEAFLNNIILID